MTECIKVVVVSPMFDKEQVLHIENNDYVFALLCEGDFVHEDLHGSGLDNIMLVKNEKNYGEYHPEDYSLYQHKNLDSDFNVYGNFFFVGYEENEREEIRVIEGATWTPALQKQLDKEEFKTRTIKGLTDNQVKAVKKLLNDESKGELGTSA